MDWRLRLRAFTEIWISQMQTQSESARRTIPTPKTTQVVEEHSHERDQQARRTEHLHPADEVKAAVEVLDLLEGGRLTFGVILVALLEAAHRGGIGEEAIGISQEDERDRRGGVERLNSVVIGYDVSDGDVKGRDWGD